MNTKAMAVTAAAAPPLLLAAATMAMLIASLGGRHPLWTPVALNISEAAAARDVATVAAMIERGEDATAPHSIRAPLLDGLPRAVTPLEAGVLARRLEVVSLLLAHGVTVTGAERDRLVCKALENGDRDIADALAGGSAPGACSR